jgi:hypothetical protein
MFPQVEFAYNAIRALGIKQTSFEANLGFISPEEPLDVMFNIRSNFDSDLARRVGAIKIVT